MSSRTQLFSYLPSSALSFLPSPQAPQIQGPEERIPFIRMRVAFPGASSFPRGGSFPWPWPTRGLMPTQLLGKGAHGALRANQASSPETQGPLFLFPRKEGDPPVKLPNCVRYKMIQELGEQGWPHPNLRVCKYAEIQIFL